MKITKECPQCGEMIYNYDTYYDKLGDASPIVHIKTKRGSHLLIHKECLHKIGASSAIAYSIIDSE